MMKIKIKLFDSTLPLPKYQSKRAAGIDLYARKDLTLPAQKVTMVPLNIALKIPADYFVLLAARSSLHKKHLMMANGIGIGDADYCGDEDEYRAALFNFGNTAVQLKKGERIVQMIILKREIIKTALTRQLTEPNRGGFGSTGSH